MKLKEKYRRCPSKKNTGDKVGNYIMKGDR